MQPLTSVQQKKLLRLAKVVDNGDIALLEEIQGLEGKIEALEAIVPALREARDGEKGEKGERGEKGESIKGERGEKGEPGRDGRDGKDSTVPGPRGEVGPMGPQGVPGRDGADGFVDLATIAYLEDEIKRVESLKQNNMRDGIGLVVRELRAGTGVTIDNSNQEYPIVSASVTGGAWGGITGTLSDQTDLQNALNAKAPALGADDNYVTDAEKTKLSNLSGVNTGDQTIKDVFGITVDGGGSTPSTGTKGYRYIEQNCTITGWHVQGDISGSIAFDVKRGGTSITGTEKPTLSTQQSNSDTTLTTWTTSLTAGDIIEFVIDSASTLTRATLTVLVTKI